MLGDKRRDLLKQEWSSALTNTRNEWASTRTVQHEKQMGGARTLQLQ
jgi:hypothetical protein